MAFISIVVPVFHNAGSLPELHRCFTDLSARNADDRFEFVFVDDGSRDNSFDVLLSLAASDPRVRIVKLSRNFGSTAALMAGLDHARGEAVAAIAADLQDPPELIHDMLARWRDGHKVVVATRASRDDPPLAAMLSRFFYALFRRFALPDMPKQGFDFFLVDRQVCDLVVSIEERNSYLMGLILWVGFHPAVIEYHRRARDARHGSSMWTLVRKLKYFVDSFVGFSYVPVRAASLLGIVTSGVGLAYAVVVIAMAIFWGKRVEGWSSLMVVMLVVSGVQMVMIGILGEYIWRNLEQTRRRPQFVVERIVEGAEAKIQAS